MSPLPPLRIVIGFSPGSASDDIAHLIAAPLGKHLGRDVIIERIAGDSGTRGARAVAQSAPDGNTLFVATLGTHALAPHVRKDLPYDAQRDFEPVSLLTLSPMLLACHPELPARDIQSLLAHARSNPGALAYGTSAIGGAPHLAAELFQSITGVQLRHARYDETNQLYADLEAGRIALSFNNIMSILPRCTSGKLRALGVTSVGRLPCVPDVPTFAENGVPGFYMSNWLGLVAPHSTPRNLLETIEKAVTAVMLSREIATALNANGITPTIVSPEAFGGHIASEIKRWAPVVARFAGA